MIVPVAVLRVVARLRRKGRGWRAIVAELARTGNGVWPRNTIIRRFGELDRPTKAAAGDDQVVKYSASSRGPKTRRGGAGDRRTTTCP